ncbi:hypothetical protein [Amycolatopsis lexingtonensis]|uniref:hypothetical protein n=1 Tax=Amycolatopsis lexingtonensis TaxID=218822 RepID=UPI003F6E5115
MDVLAGPARWWASVTGRGRYVNLVVVGPRKSGKSALFAGLASRGNVVLWDVRRLARARSTGEVWADLFSTLGAGPVGERPIEDLADHLDTLERGPVLVVDHWDEAVDGRGHEVPDHCYEVLDELSRFCLGQAMTRQPGEACLGIALLTSLPAPSDVEHFSRAVRRPTFERLSTMITRLFVTEPFPALDKADAECVLAARGVPAELTSAVADACGGWLWLLCEAADAVRAHGGWTEEAIEHVRAERLPVLLDEAIVKWLAARPGVRGAPLDHLARQLSAGRPPAEFGVPHAFGDLRQAAPLIRQLLSRTFIVVDIENVRVPHQRHADVDPEAYPDGVEKYLQQWIGEWLRVLRARHNVGPGDVWFVGRSPALIDAVVGAQTPGQRLALPEPLRKKAKQGDNSDDTLLTAKVTQQAERNPFASFVLATGDADHSFVLDIIGLLDQIVVSAPWRASDELRKRLPDRTRLREHTFPRRRPREVSDTERRAAQQWRVEKS